MYGVVREFQPPLGVTHAVRGRFGTAPASLATVFARKNSLDLYIVRANDESARLELLSSISLGTTIISLAVVRRPTHTSDLLFVGFERMRVAVLSWHPDTFSWNTEQLIDIGRLLGTGSCKPEAITLGLDSKCKWRPLLRGISGCDSDPVIRSDPSGHCVAVLSKNHGIFYILPIRSDEDSNTNTSNSTSGASNDGGKIVNHSSAFIIDLRSEYEASNVKDFTFLQGMFEPHLVILHETKRTWSGRTAVQRNTCSLLTISIDLRSKRSSNSWGMDQLPYDCDKLEAVPDSARGGVMVLSSSVIMQVRHGRCVAGLSLNCYGDAYALELKQKYETIIHSETLVECDAAHIRFLDVEEMSSDSSQSIALLSLKGGELYFLHVAVDSQSAITMKRAGSTVIASEIVPVNERFFILSSRLSDSLLIEYKRVQEEQNDPDDAILNGNDNKNNSDIDKKKSVSNGNAGKDNKISKGKKRKRTAHEDEEYEMMYGVKPPPRNDDDDSDDASEEGERTLELNETDEQGTRGVYDDDDELGFVFKSDASNGAQQGGGNWALTVKDTVACFGPGADITTGPSPKDPNQKQLDLVVAGGYAKNGCLAVVHQSIRPSTFTEFPIAGCEGVWTLTDPTILRRQRDERATRNAQVMKRNEACRARNLKVKESRRESLLKAIAELKEDKKRELLSNSEGTNGPLEEIREGASDTLVTPNETSADVQIKDTAVEAVDTQTPANANDKLSAQNGTTDKTNAEKENVESLVNAEQIGNVPSKQLSTDKSNTDDLPEEQKTAPDDDKSMSKDDESEDLYAESDQDAKITTNAVTDNSNTDGTKDQTEDNLSDMDMKDVTEEDLYATSDPETSDTPPKNEQGKPENEPQNAQEGKSEDKTENSSRYQNSTESSPVQKRPRTMSPDTSTVDAGDSLADLSVELDKEEIINVRQHIEANMPLEEEEALESAMEGEEEFHSYMLLSTSKTTTVLATDSDLEEVMPGATDFVTSERTIVTGNILKNHAIVQVVPSKVRVIRNGKKQCEFSVEEGKPKIAKAQICDSLILLHSEDNQLIILRVEAESFLEAKTGEKESTGFGEEEFDEYGMAVSKDTDKPSEEDLKDSKDEAKEQSYRNFSITEDFNGSKPFGGVDITSAFLYKGQLATDIAEDGVLTIVEQRSVETVEEGNTAVKSTEETVKINTTKEVKSKTNNEVEKKSEDLMDDEDRMLYDDDEEDKLLYGGIDENETNNETINEVPQSNDGKITEEVNGALSSNASNSMKKNLQHPEKGVAYLDGSPSDDEQGYLLVLVSHDGGLRILSRELQYATILDCPFMYTAPNLVTDSPIDDSGKKDKKRFPAAKPEYRIDGVFMTEVIASCHLPGFSTPYLMFTSHSGLPVIYRAFLKPKSVVRGKSRSRLGLRRIVFRDGTTRWFSRLIKKASKKTSLNQENGGEDSTKGIRGVKFENICGRSGVFLGGECPAFLFAERGYPRIHELTYINRTGETVSRETFENGQGVLSFAQFHNMSCPRGFVYVGDDHVVRIGALPEKGDVNYDAPTPFNKIALRCTPHKVAYHGGSATYGVLASMPTLTTREERLARILQSLEKHDKRHYQHTAAQAEAETGDERGDRVPPLFEELHELRVYRPDNWNLIRSHKLQKGEVGLAITNMKVDVYKQRMAGPGVEIPSSKRADDGNESQFAASIKLRPKDVLVVGTGFLNGEDASSRGRLLLFEISRQEVYTEAGGAYTAFQLQLIAEKEVVSPVTAVASMEGYVIAGVGPLISVYKLVGDEIVHLSFAFGQLYCSSIASLKQYVVAADICKSITFMYFRERNNSVNFLGQDYDKVTCYATEFLIENDKMSMIVADGEGNLRLFNFLSAYVPESHGGKRLLMNGGIHIGSRVNKLMRVRTPDGELDLKSGEARQRAGKQTLLFATLDGGIGAVVGVSEEEFRRFQKIRNVVKQYDGVRRFGGVNMDEVNAMRLKGCAIEQLDQRLLDSRCVFDMFDMSLVEMNVVSRMCGLKLEQFAMQLLELDSILWRF